MTHQALDGDGLSARSAESQKHDPQPDPNLDLSARLTAAEAALARETRRTAALNRIAAAIGAGHTLEATVQTVVDGGVELSGAAFGAFFYNVVDPAGERYTLYSLSGAPPAAFEAFPMPRNTAVFAPTFSGEGVVRSEDITLDPRYGQMKPHRGMPAGHLPVKSYLAVPVISHSGEVLGGLFFGHPEAARFGQREEQVMTGLAAQAAVAIDNVRLIEASRRELEERRMAEQRQRLLLNELNHRVKNTLATVQSISSQTLRSCATPQGFNTAFEARLAALSEAHNLLNSEAWGAARLTDLVKVEIAPYDPAFQRLAIDGDGEVRLAANPAVTLGMALHELATNAAKYGALSSPEGCVTVRWRHASAEEARSAFGGASTPAALAHQAAYGAGEHLLIDWIETGGPQVTTPEHTGFGAKLLKRGLATQLAGVVDIDYDPEGLRCRMDIPLEALELSA